MRAGDPELEGTETLVAKESLNQATIQRAQPEQLTRRKADAAEVGLSGTGGLGS